VTLECLGRLSDLSTEMGNVQTTLGWAGIFLVLALKSRNKLAILKALRCLGQIFVAHGDDNTALSLFTVALDGLTIMDVHHWKADCMIHIADIWERKGEILKSVCLWKVARPLFQRSSQMKDVARIDRKLADMDSAILEENNKKLQQLAELKASVRELEDAHIDEDEELQCLLQAEGAFVELAI
jgi:hypothetical protein